jgi:hypothetical protein
LACRWCIISFASLQTLELKLGGQFFAQLPAIFAISPNFVCAAGVSVAETPSAARTASVSEPHAGHARAWSRGRAAALAIPTSLSLQKTLTGSAVGLASKSLTVGAWAGTDARIAVARREEFLWQLDIVVLIQGRDLRTW